MFYGEYLHSIDRKGRLIIPSKFREVFKERYAERFFITRGLDQCLFLFTEDEWKTQESKFKGLPFTRQEIRKFNRLYFSGASEVACDGQGRILIPAYLKEYADVKRDVTIVGVSNRIEIWSRERWQEFFRASKDSFEELAEKILEENRNP
jgi:MraZ protein